MQIKTIGEFINECCTYQYSKEYFELLKESYEYELREKYKENMRFLQSAQYEEMSKNCSFSENYFQDYKSSVFTEDGAQSSKGLFGNIGSFFSNLWKGFVNSLKKIGTKLNGTEFVDLEEIGSAWKTRTWTAKEVKYIIDDRKIDMKTWAGYRVKTPEGPAPRLKFENGVEAETQVGFSNYITSVCVKGANVDMSSKLPEIKTPEWIKSLMSKGSDLLNKVTEDPAKSAAIGAAGVTGTVLTVGGICKIVGALNKKKEDLNKPYSQFTDEELEQTVEYIKQTWAESTDTLVADYKDGKMEKDEFVIQLTTQTNEAMKHISAIQEDLQQREAERQAQIEKDKKGPYKPISKQANVPAADTLKDTGKVAIPQEGKREPTLTVTNTPKPETHTPQLTLNSESVIFREDGENAGGLKEKVAAVAAKAKETAGDVSTTARKKLIELLGWLKALCGRTAAFLANYTTVYIAITTARTMINGVKEGASNAFSIVKGLFGE